MALLKSIEEIEISDIQDLIGSEREGRIIEFKESLKLEDNREKEEFLADVSSFANSSGGHIIYGVREEDGVASEMCGFETDGMDSLILKIENMLRNSLSPRINNKEIKPLRLEDGKYVLIMKIPRSWNSPHMVELGGKDKFYIRNSAGKHPMSVDELRTAFLLSESITEKIKSFRRERLGIIESGETPIVLQNEAKIVLHLIPFSSIDKSNNYELSFLTRPENIGLLRTILTESINPKYNVDGLVVHDSHNFSYTQIFRQGIIEAVSHPSWRSGDSIPSVAYEKWILEATQKYLEILYKLNVDFPILIMVSLMGVKGFKMGISNELEWRLVMPTPQERGIDRDNLIINEVIMNNKNEDISKVLKPIFDTVWNSCGFSCSLNYNEGGEWGKGRNSSNL